MPASLSQGKSQSELLGVAHPQQRSSLGEDGRPAPTAHQLFTKQQQQQPPQHQQQQQQELRQQAMSSDVRSSASSLSLSSDSSKRKHPDRPTTTTAATTTTDPASACASPSAASASASASAAASKRYRRDRFCYTSLSTLCAPASSSLTQEVPSCPASSASCVEDAEEQQQQQQGGIMLVRGPRYRVSAKSGSTRPGSVSAKRMHHQLLKLPATQEASCDALSLVDTAGGIVTKLSTAGTCRSNEATSRESEDEDVTSSDPDYERRKGQGRAGQVHGQGQGPGPGPLPLAMFKAGSSNSNSNSNSSSLSQLLGSKRRKFDPFETCHAEVELAAVIKRRSSQQDDDVVHDTHAAALTLSKVEEGGVYYRAHADASITASAAQDDQTAPAPVFVLSSGRISKGEEARLGKRPPTVDDEFDQYFSQLIL